MKKLPKLLLLAVLFLNLLSGFNIFAQKAFAQSSEKWALWGGAKPEGIIQKDADQITNNDLNSAVTAIKGPNVDVKMQIVQKISDVRSGKLTPEDFYKQVSDMKMPEGKEVRHVLMEVKKDIGNYLGENGLRKVFGELYPSGGSKAESIILSHRKDVVMQTIKQVIKDFAGEDLKFTVYYSEVGGWPDEGPKDMKFAGDIDFNFLCGDLETALKLKKAYDAYIVKRYGRTPEDLDIPCTVHGMATGEVYVGKKGQGFAEIVTNNAKKINFNEDGKGVRLEEGVPFSRALGNMLAEAEFSKTPLANLENLKWPTEPGVSLEMIRHFEHDIVRQNVYTDLESFVKAAKYTDRSFSALEADGKNGVIKDKLLRNLTKELVKAKKSPKKQVDLLEAYYKSKAKPLPFDAELDLNTSGKITATLKYNEKLIKEFWNDCRKTMWQSANNKLKKVVGDFKKHASSLEGKNSQEVKALYDELNKYNEMMEIEDRVLTDDKAGLHDKMNSEYQKLIGEFRDVVKTFKQQAAKHDHLKVIDPAKSDTYKFIDEQLKLGNKLNVRMAVAALAQAPGKVNDMLDFFDDNLMNRFRYGETKNFDQFLRSGKKAFWDDQASYFMGKGDLRKYSEHTRQSKLKVRKISSELTAELRGNLASRGLRLAKRTGGVVFGGIQKANNEFNKVVGGHQDGQTLMKAMMIYNLSQEIPVYINYVAKGDYNGLATEFFRRRIPFGGAVERGVMGDYYGVAWEVTATLLPPAAIFSAASSIGESIGTEVLDFYLSEELEIFTDNLYENADFAVVGVEKAGDNIKISEWKLLSVTYNEEKFDLDELIQIETADAREMEACLQKPSQQRPECFPMDKISNGLFQWFRNKDAFERIFDKSDPWLQMISEMIKDKNAGVKLKNHFRYQRYTRLEYLKVEFLKQIQKKLVERRSGEQSLLSGDFPRMYEELLSIAEDLDIRPQIEESIENEFGGGITQFVTSLKDYLRGTVREINGDVNIWDVQEELASFVTKYLRTYQRIVDERKEAENLLTFKGEDQGLHILTGPYFLKGIFDEDAMISQEWSQYPAEFSKEIGKTLTKVKKKIGMDPFTLDLSDGSLDKNTLHRLVYHKTFSELWVRVNKQFDEEKVKSYLGQAPSTQDAANEEGIISDQDRAVMRVKFHEQRIKEILVSFEKDSETKAAIEEVGNSLDKLRITKQKIINIQSQVTALVTRINSLGKQLSRQWGQAVTQMNEFKADQTISEESIIIKDAFLDAMPDIAAISTLLAETRTAIKNASMELCQTYSEIKEEKNINALDKIIIRTRASSKEVTDYFEQYTQNKKYLNQSKNKLKEVEKEFTKIKQQEKYLKRFEKIEALLTKSKNYVEEIDNLMDAIMDNQSVATALNSHANQIVKKVKSLDSEGVSDEELKTIQAALDLKEEIEDSLTDINKAESKLSDESLFDKTQIADLFAQLKFMRRPFLKDIATDSGKSVEKSREELKQAFGRIAAAEIFYDAIDAAHKSARKCFNEGEKLYDAKTPYEEREAQADCSDFVGTEAKWHAELSEVLCDCKDKTKKYHNQLKRCATKVEFAVAKANCNDFEGTRARWHKDTQDVRCDCIDSKKKYSGKFGRCISQQEFKVDQKECSKWSNTEAVWSSSKKSAVCDCIDDHQWNRAHTFCIKKPQLQIKKANCSRWSHSEAIWNSEKEKVECDCRGNYEWNNAQDSCRKKSNLQVDSTRCSKWPNSTPVWNNRKERVECDCRGDYEWNAPANNVCRIKKEIQVANANCKDSSGTHPEWSDKHQDVRCFCDDGFWSSSEKRCISEYEQEQARRQQRRKQEERDRRWEAEQRRQEAEDKAVQQRECKKYLGQLNDSVVQNKQRWEQAMYLASTLTMDCDSNEVLKAQQGKWRHGGGSGYGQGAGGSFGGGSGSQSGGYNGGYGDVDYGPTEPEKCSTSFGLLGMPSASAGGEEHCMSNAEYEKAMRKWRQEVREWQAK